MRFETFRLKRIVVVRVSVCVCGTQRLHAVTMRHETRAYSNTAQCDVNQTSPVGLVQEQSQRLQG